MLSEHFESHGECLQNLKSFMHVDCSGKVFYCSVFFRRVCLKSMLSGCRSNVVGGYQVFITKCSCITYCTKAMRQQRYHYSSQISLDHFHTWKNRLQCFLNLCPKAKMAVCPTLKLSNCSRAMRSGDIQRLQKVFTPLDFYHILSCFSLNLQWITFYIFCHRYTQNTP